jgi:hypothetical protein
MVFGFRVWGFGLRVWDLESKIKGIGYMVSKFKVKG